MCKYMDNNAAPHIVGSGFNEKITENSLERVEFAALIIPPEIHTMIRLRFF